MVELSRDAKQVKNLKALVVAKALKLVVATKTLKLVVATNPLDTTELSGLHY